MASDSSVLLVLSMQQVSTRCAKSVFPADNQVNRPKRWDIERTDPYVLYAFGKCLLATVLYLHDPSFTLPLATRPHLLERYLFAINPSVREDIVPWQIVL